MDIAIINKHFNKRQIQMKDGDKWFFDGYGEYLERNRCSVYWNNFTGIRDPHVPCAFRKTTFEKVWDAEYEILDRTCMDKFRSMGNVNQWLIRYWQLCEGDFVPRRTLGKSYVVTLDNCQEISDVIRHKEQQMICINEQCKENDFEKIRDTVNAAFAELFPYKSSFEK